MRRVSFYNFLKGIASAKICIDLPGNGYLCHRLVEYMGIGVCIISPRNPNRLIVPLEDRKHIVFCNQDLSGLVDLCMYYDQNDYERELIVQNSREYVDLNLHSCLERLVLQL
jgi:hypothetical protein